MYPPDEESLIKLSEWAGFPFSEMASIRKRKTGSNLVDDADNLNWYIGEQIRYVRKRMGMSQHQACVEVFGAETVQGLWSRWERGIVRPNVGTLEKIAKWASVPVSSFGVHDPKGMPTEAEVREARELLARAMILLGG